MRPFKRNCHRAPLNIHTKRSRQLKDERCLVLERLNPLVTIWKIFSASGWGPLGWWRVSHKPFSLFSQFASKTLVGFVHIKCAQSPKTSAGAGNTWIERDYLERENPVLLHRVLWKWVAYRHGRHLGSRAGQTRLPAQLLCSCFRTCSDRDGSSTGRGTHRDTLDWNKK